jgi:hypothetical protein
MRRLLAGLCGLSLVAASGAAAAHDSFIVPPGLLPAGQPIRLEVTSSSFFPAPESGIRPERVARIEARSNEALTTNLAAGDAAMQVALAGESAVSPLPGGLVVAIDLSPHDIDVGTDEVGHYMDEIGAPPEIIATVEAAVARDGVLRETYTKHLKLIGCIERCDGLDGWRRTGSSLEFVSVGDTWVLLENGAPRAGQAVFVTTEAEGRRKLITDDGGAVRLAPDTTGAVFLAAVVLTPPAEPGGRFTSEWAALTLDAAAR